MFTTVEEINKKYKININIDENNIDDLLNLFNTGIEQLNLTEAQICIHALYHETVTKNYVLMKKYLMMAIELGNVKSMNKLANYYKIIVKDYVEMTKYYMMAIELGDTYAMNSLAYYHKTVTKDYVLMEKYYMMAIELGDTSAMNNLAYYHKNVTKDYVLMEKYYMMAIELGYTNAMNNLAYYHKTVTKDYVLMEKYFMMAIKLRGKSAMHGFAHYHKTVTNNYVEMTKDYMMAIELGDTDAMNSLAYYHQYTTEDYVEMTKYYMMAIELGDTNAMNSLADYHKYTTNNYIEMTKYYMMAIELGDTSAMYNLAHYHQYNTKDHVEMTKYYMMAIESGHTINIREIYGDKTFEIMENYYDSKDVHTDIFLKLYTKEFQSTNGKQYISDSLKKIEKTVSKIAKYIYEKYIKVNEACTSLYKTDFTIIGVVDGIVKNYSIHSLFLDSEYFCVLIDGEFMETKSITIDVSSFLILDILIKYLYINELDSKNMSIEQIMELRTIADQYDFNGLFIRCNWQIKSCLVT
jgi:TPR repeat protein